MKIIAKSYEEMSPVERAVFDEAINRPVTPINIRNFHRLSTYEFNKAVNIEIAAGAVLDMEIEEAVIDKLRIKTGYDVKRCSFCPARHLFYRAGKPKILAHKNKRTNDWRVQTKTDIIPDEYKNTHPDIYKISGYALDTVIEHLDDDELEKLVCLILA